MCFLRLADWSYDPVLPQGAAAHLRQRNAVGIHGRLPCVRGGTVVVVCGVAGTAGRMGRWVAVCGRIKADPPACSTLGLLPTALPLKPRIPPLHLCFELHIASIPRISAVVSLQQQQIYRCFNDRRLHGRNFMSDDTQWLLSDLTAGATKGQRRLQVRGWVGGWVDGWVAVDSTMFRPCWRAWMHGPDCC